MVLRERCRSGRTGRSRKPLTAFAVQGFESLSLRKSLIAICRTKSCKTLFFLSAQIRHKTISKSNMALCYMLYNLLLHYFSLICFLSYLSFLFCAAIATLFFDRLLFSKFYFTHKCGIFRSCLMFYCQNCSVVCFIYDILTYLLNLC